MRRLLPTCLLLLGTAAVVAAQDRANFPWWNSPVASEIVSPAQAQQIRAIVRSYRDRLFDARNNQHKAEAALEDALNESEVRPDDVRPFIERVASARANTSRVFLSMSIQVRSVLTIDQWRTLVQRWEELRRKRPTTDTQGPP